MLRIVTDELAALGADGVTERELAIAKGNLRAETLLACEDSGARMSRIGAGMLLHGEVLSVDEVLARVDALTLEDVHAAARELAAAPRTLSVVGPVRRVGVRRRRPVARIGPGRPCGTARSDAGRQAAGRRPPRSATAALARVAAMRVGVVGAGGRMGREVCRTVLSRPGLELVGRRRSRVTPAPDVGELIGVDAGAGPGRSNRRGRVDGLVEAGVEVAVDFTQLEVSRATIAFCADAGIHAVVGTTGFTEADLAELGRQVRPGDRLAGPTASSPPTSPSGPCS